jgi:stress-induced morphogen
VGGREALKVAINIPRGERDAVIDKIIETLRRYEADHPRAQIDLYRQNRVSVRVRIVDPEFAGQGKPQRSQQAWKYLDDLPDDVQSDISTVLLLTPDERQMSFANFEFDDPIPSRL